MDNFPWKITELEPNVNAELVQHIRGEPLGYVRVGPKGYLLRNSYRTDYNSYYNFNIKPGDVFVCGYPRSGTTWFQELVWLIVNDLNYEQYYSEPLRKRSFFLFENPLHPDVIERLKEENRLKGEDTLKMFMSFMSAPPANCEDQPSPRVLKAHCPLSLLPPNLLDSAKVIYIVRDPRDVVVSMYHLFKSTASHDYVGDFKTFWNFFIKDLLLWSPYFENVKEAWEQRHHPNMLFMFYEESVKDFPKAAQRVSEFLGKNYTREQIETLCKHLSFENFKKNKSVNFDELCKVGLFKQPGQFIRKGQSGGWRDYFDEEMKLQSERWLTENLRDTDFKFPHMNNFV